MTSITKYGSVPTQSKVHSMKYMKCMCLNQYNKYELRAPPSVVVFLRIISGIDTISRTEELEMVCVALQENCDLRCQR